MPQFHLNSAHQASINKNTVKPEVFEERNMPAPVENASRSINPFSSETFCERKERHQEENQPPSLPYRTADASKASSDLDYGQTVC